MPTVLPQRIPASASMIIDSDWPPDRIGRQIVSVDAPVPPKPARRVPEDTEVLSDVYSLQPAARSWTWFVALLGASADCLWSALILEQTLEFEVRDELLHSKFSELVRSVLRWCQIGQSCNSQSLWRRMNGSGFVLHCHWGIDVLSVSVAADRSTNVLSFLHEHPSSAPRRWQHPGRWRLFRRQFQENAATVLVYRSLQAVFYCQSRYTVSCWDSVSSGSMTSSLWFRRWCLRAQWERASLHSNCSAGMSECRPHIAEPQHQLFPQLRVHLPWRARIKVVQALIPAAPQCLWRATRNEDCRFEQTEFDHERMTPASPVLNCWFQRMLGVFEWGCCDPRSRTQLIRPAEREL